MTMDRGLFSRQRRTVPVVGDMVAVHNVLTGEFAQAPFDAATRLGQSLLPTGAIAQTMPRGVAQSTTVASVSGRLMLTQIYLPVCVITNMKVCSGNTASVAPLNQWGCLYDINGNRLGVTNDDTTNVWTQSAPKTFTFATPVSILTEGYYNLGIMVAVTTTMNTFVGAVSPGALASLPPIPSGRADAGLTTPATAPAVLGTNTANANAFWAQVA